MSAHKARKNTIGIWSSTDKVCYDNAKTAVKKYNIIKLTEKKRLSLWESSRRRRVRGRYSYDNYPLPSLRAASPKRGRLNLIILLKNCCFCVISFYPPFRSELSERHDFFTFVIEHYLYFRISSRHKLYHKLSARATGCARFAIRHYCKHL